MAVDHRQIDALGLAPLELRFQPLLRARVFREDDEAGRVAVDPVHDERPALVRAEVILDQLLDRRGVASSIERHRQQSRWFVQH